MGRGVLASGLSLAAAGAPAWAGALLLVFFAAQRILRDACASLVHPQAS